MCDRGVGVALATLAAAVVLGILGMHALTLQGAHRGDQPGGTATAVVHGEHAPGDGDGDGEGGGHGTHDLMVLCLALLAAAVLLLPEGLRRGVLRRSEAPSAGLREALRRPGLRGGAGPPTAWRFSVIRC